MPFDRLPLSSRRARKGAVTVFAYAAASLATVASHAQTSLDQPFPEGFALSPIEPAPAGDHFFLVGDGWSHPAAPEGTLPLRAMAFGHLTLTPPLRRTDNATGESRNLVERQLYAHANLTVYPIEQLLLNVDVPVAALQEGQGPNAPSTALGDLRFGLRVGLLGDRNSAFTLGPAVDVWAPTGDPDELTGDGRVRVHPKIAVSGRVGPFVYAGNVGYLFRKHFNPGSLEIGSSLTYGAAAGLLLFDDVLQIGPEIVGRSLVASNAGQNFRSDTTALTGLVGARVQLGDFNLGAGIGPGLSEAPGTATRVFASLTFLPQGKVDGRFSVEAKGRVEAKAQASWDPAKVDSDGDDIPDADDACPELLGKPSDDPKQHGCPVSPSAPQEPEPEPPADRDGDGILDSEDACPDEPGVRDTSDPSRRGCVETTPIAEQKAVVEQKPVAPPPPRAPEGPPVATFVGYRQLGPKRVLVYVELTQATGVEFTGKGRTLEYTMQQTRVTLRNNRNPLLAQHFDSVVQSARLVPTGKNLKLVIQLRRDAEQVSRLVRHATGATLEVELTEVATPAQ